MSEIDKLQVWIDSEKANGLVDIKLFLAPGAEKLTTEELAAELLKFNKAAEHGKLVNLDEFDKDL